MKNRGTRVFISVLFLTIVSLFSTSQVKAQGYGQVSFDLFYNELSPYGYWDNDPNYGDIWYPSVGNDFRPYSSNGYWTMTQYGNTWVSNYDWGWAPFHYGRWVYTNHRGWGWTPGYEWGPAWVDWRSGNGYYGWAPMAPRVSINISIGLPINLWVFAPSRRIYDRNIYKHSYYGRPNIYNNTTIINNTYVVNNNHYYGGPSRRDVERTTGRRITVRDVRTSDRPGVSTVDNRSVSIYRPEGNSRGSSSTNRPNRTTTVERNDRPTSSTPNRSDNRISREMYIGKDGNTTIRERSDNRNINTRDNRNENTNRPERVISSSQNNRSPQRPTTEQRSVPNRESSNVGRMEPSRQTRTQNTQPQIQQRESRSQSERSNSGGFQTVKQESRSNNNSGGIRSQRVERSSSSSNRGNSGISGRTTSEGSSSRGSR